MYLNTVFKYNVFKYCPALATMWSVDMQSGQEGSLTHPTGYRVAVRPG